jgi:hypothetical protein
VPQLAICADRVPIRAIPFSVLLRKRHNNKVYLSNLNPSKPQRARKSQKKFN